MAKPFNGRFATRTELDCSSATASKRSSRASCSLGSPPEKASGCDDHVQPHRVGSDWRSCRLETTTPAPITPATATVAAIKAERTGTDRRSRRRRCDVRR